VGRRCRAAHIFKVAVVALVIIAGCGKPEADSPGANRPEIIRGEPIASASPTRTAPGRVATAGPSTNVTDVVENGFIRLGFDRLSAFKYELYEIYSETNSGRPLLKSDDTIPAAIKAFNGKRVSVRGFVLPLRIKRAKTIEFLLLRDQGSCCFGPQAQINHFIRVRYPAGGEFEQGRAYKASGALQVGEVFVQGYLTGLYNLDAEKVELSEPD